MKDLMSKRSIYIIMFILTIFALILGGVYANDYMQTKNELKVSKVKIDEEAFGEAVFNSDYYQLKPIMDEKIIENNENVIKFGFRIGGDRENDVDNIIYDISLAELEIDCELLSPYLKWRLYKNGEIISEGSFDYGFDTIKEKRLVLTNIQQDLKPYSEDKTLYDLYDLYIWMSDSCQDENILECLDKSSQNEMLAKNIKGRINVELRTGRKKEYVRTPSEVLDDTSCVKKVED